MPDPEAVTAAARGAVVAEVGWRRDDGAVGLAARTPLVLGGEPALALTYDDLDLAQRLADATSAILVVSDSRRALRGWQPLAVPVAPSVTSDPEGETFVAELVEQELRKYPPARLRADSLLQRRENWWYLARVLVRLRPLAAPRPVPARHEADSGVLCWDAGERLAATTVEVDDWAGDRLRLRPQGGDVLGGAPSRGSVRPPRGSVPAALLRHDFSADLERRATLVVTGRLAGDTLWPQARAGEPVLPPVPGVWRRLRQATAFERACRRAIDAAGH